jgi:hypothetical protein
LHITFFIYFIYLFIFTLILEEEEGKQRSARLETIPFVCDGFRDHFCQHRFYLRKTKKAIATTPKTTTPTAPTTQPDGPVSATATLPVSMTALAANVMVDILLKKKICN